MSAEWPPAKQGYMWWSTEGCKDILRYLFGESGMVEESAFVNELPEDTFRELAPSLPPFYLLICDLDCLRDGALDFARRLLEVRVRTEVHVVAGTPHYFVGYAPYTSISLKTKEGYLRAMEAALKAWD